MDHIMKNIDFEKVISLEDMVDYQSGQVVSRTISQNKAVSITLFAFDKGEEISSHASGGDAMVCLLDGKAEITIGTGVFQLEKGQTIVMPAGISHALSALEQFKMLLVVLFSQ